MKKSITFKNGMMYKVFALALGTSILTMSCSDDDKPPVVVDEEEVITTMNITLTAASGNITLQSKDLDGDGKADLSEVKAAARQIGILQ